MGSGLDPAGEEIETAEGEESEDADGPRVKRTRQVYPRSGFSQAPSSIMPGKPKLKQRDSREYRNFRRHFRIPYEFLLERVYAGKAPKVILTMSLVIGCIGRGREVVYILSVVYLN